MTIENVQEFVDFKGDQPMTNSTRSHLMLFSRVSDFVPAEFINGTPLHPGASSGMLITQPENFTTIRRVSDNLNRIPVIYAVDEGSCEDLATLSHSNGFLSSNGSPNAWCAVQAKSEGLPSIIGLDT